MAEPMPTEVKINLLVVEDEEDLRFLIGCFFETVREVDVRLCASAEEAEGTVAEFKPHMALIDFNLRGKRTSLDLCRDLERDFPDCHLYVMSGVVTQETVDAAEGVGVDAFIQKPFSFQALLDRITRAIRHAGSDTFSLTRYPVATHAQIDTFRNLLDKDPNDIATRQLLAFSLYTAQKYADAAAEYEIVFESGYSSFLAQYYAGHTYARMRRYEDAIDHWEQAMKKAPSTMIESRVRMRISQARKILRVENEMKSTAPGTSFHTP